MPDNFDKFALSLESEIQAVSLTLDEVRKTQSSTEVRHRWSEGCVHWQRVIDQTSRTVVCKGCGKQLDAFDVLVRLVQDGDLGRARAQRRELDLEIERLRSEETRIKARTRMASRKEASEAVAVERAKLADERSRIARNAREIASLAGRIAKAASRGDAELREVLNDLAADEVPS